MHGSGSIVLKYLYLDLRSLTVRLAELILQGRLFCGSGTSVVAAVPVADLKVAAIRTSPSFYACYFFLHLSLYYKI